MRILFTGGGTGGHTFPLIATIREIRNLYLKKDLEFFYLGPKDEFNLILLSQEDVRVKTILAGKIRRYFSFQNFIDVLFKFLGYQYFCMNQMLFLVYQIGLPANGLIKSIYLFPEQNILI